MSLATGNVKQDWKLAIIPIAKPGMPTTAVDLYLPISLFSCIGELMEKLICNRINYLIECSFSLSYTQCGF